MIAPYVFVAGIVLIVGALFALAYRLFSMDLD